MPKTTTLSLLSTLLVTAALAAAGCGDSDGGGGGGGARSGPASDDAELKFARCMREKGVDIPDPNGSGGPQEVRIPGNVPPNKLQEFTEECREKTGGGPREPTKAEAEEFREKGLKFAQCMRRNGIDVPDPSSDGGIIIGGPGKGPSPDSAAFKKAQAACEDLLPRPGGATAPGETGGAAPGAASDSCTVKRVVITALPLLAAGAVAAVLLAGGGDEPQAVAGRSGLAVGTVERRTLVERARVDGTLGYGNERAVVNRLSGTVTWLAPEGSVVKPGETLLRVDGSPVVLMDGRVPAYRTLKAGVTDGADVRQLESNLKALGHEPGTVDEEWDADTTAAVKAWQDARGLDETGEVELGRVVFLPGARRISDHEVEVGSSDGAGAMASTGGGSTAQGGWSDIPGSTPARTGRLAEAGTTTPTTPTTPQTTPTTPTTTTPTTPTTPKTTPTTPTTPKTTPTTTTPSPTSPSSSDGGGAIGGGGGGGGGAEASGGGGDSASTTVMTATSTRRVVTLSLDAADQAIAREGVKVDVELPDGSTVRGRVARVGRVAKKPESDGGGPGEEESEAQVTVTVRLTGRGGGRLDQAPVSVELARQTRANVLAVPVTALVAQRGGGYALDVIDGGRRRLVKVEAGLFADGYVEVSGDGLRAGMKIALPRS